MVGKIQKRLISLLESSYFITKSIQVNLVVELSLKNKSLAGWLRNGALKLNIALNRDVFGQVVNPCRHKNRSTICRRICGLKSIAIIGRTIADCAIVTHIHHRHQITYKYICDVFDFDVFNADQTAAWTRNVYPKVTVGRVAPNQIDANPIASCDNRADFNHFAVGRQSCARSNFNQSIGFAAVRLARPP